MRQFQTIMSTPKLLPTPTSERLQPTKGRCETKWRPFEEHC